MQGNMKVYYTVQCDNDISTDVTLEQILSSEKIIKLIKLEFAKKSTHLEIEQLVESLGVVARIKSSKMIYEFEMLKDDFVDALTFAEEDAKKNKRLKKSCQGVELVDIVTL